DIRGIGVFSADRGAKHAYVMNASFGTDAHDLVCMFFQRDRRAVVRSPEYSNEHFRRDRAQTALHGRDVGLAQAGAPSKFGLGETRGVPSRPDQFRRLGHIEVLHELMIPMVVWVEQCSARSVASRTVQEAPDICSQTPRTTV